MTRPALPPETVHLPFEAGAYRMAMGLMAQKPDDLLEIDENYPVQLAERRHLLDTRHSDVFAALPGSEAACAEVLDRLTELLPRRYPDWFQRRGAWLDNRLTGECWNLDDPGLHPLDLAGRLTQEDWCVLHLTDTAPVFVAANLCFPTRWKLQEKIGKPLLDVHGPVPLYAEKLGTPVDRFLAQIKPGKLVQRLNWGLNDDPELFQPERRYRDLPDASFTPDNVGQRLFVRVERQTLSLLPQSGGVLFGIRVHVYPLWRIAAQAEAAGRLAAAIRAIPYDLRRYKTFFGYEGVLLAYLDSNAATLAA